MKEVIEREVTGLFRSLTRYYGISTSQMAYVYADDELWYRGESIENTMTEAEKRCLEHAIGETLNRRLTTI
jgi:hypothetical protein